MMPDAHAADDELIGSRVGPYEISELIARGGMGAVYKARQPSLQRYVAIKTLPRDVLEQEDSHVLFHREAEIVARLEHPNILPIFDYGEHGSIPYLVMPLIGGGTLLDWDPGPLDQALPVISRVLGALEYAHAQHVVHRDIKPTNIMMHHGDWPLLGDFGLARIVDPRLYLTRPGYRVGTPGFMAPEQIEGENADHRADLYAMGVILFAVLTGSLPYEDDDVDTLLALHLNEPVPSPLALNPVLAPVWEDIVQRSLAKDPTARFASAREMDAAILAAWQTHQRATDTTVETIDPHELASQAALALGQSDWPRVIALCGRILESDPGHHAATYLLSQAQENMRRQRAAQLVQRADESLAGGRLADARRYYQVALTLVPALAAARDGLALLARVDAPTLETPAPAFELSEEAAAWYAQGLAAAAHADWAESIAALRQVVALAPDFHEAGLRLDEAERALAGDDGRLPEARVEMRGADAEPATEVAAGLSAVGAGEQAAAAARRPGDLLLVDHFGSAEFGHLPVVSPEPGRYRLEYRWGQYAITHLDPTWTEAAWVPVPGTYDDAAMIVDVVVAGGAGREVRLNCRGADSPAVGYQLHLAPGEGRFAVYRCDDGHRMALVDWQDSPAIRPGDEPNRLQLSATGASLSVSINGERVADLRDATYSAGTFWLGVYAASAAPAEAVFAGFQVLQQ